jgi:hypothetical protein
MTHGGRPWHPPARFAAERLLDRQVVMLPALARRVIGAAIMASAPNDQTPSEPALPEINITSIKTDSKDIVRRAGRKSLQATVYWCIGSVLCLFVNRIIAVAVLFGAIFQLTANYKWLAKTKILTEDELQKWTRRLRWLTAMVVLVALIHIAGIVLLLGVLTGSIGPQ